MKVTLVSPPPNLSGGARVIAIHADQLARRGHDVTVVAPARRQPTLKSRIRDLARGRRPKTPPTESHYDGM